MADLPVVDNQTPVPVSLDPGFFSEATARGAKNRWKDGDRVRFKDGLPQKMGGWATQAISNVLLPTQAFQGVDRKELEWTALDNSKWLAQGTSKKLYLVMNNVRYDITPVRSTETLTNPFTTINGSPLVTVADASHGAAQGDFVRFSGASAVGGLTINGEYSITTINDGNSYVITASGNASSGATGGGSVVASYDISIGFDSATQANGWGTCGYGQGTFGTRRGACSGLTLPLRTWSLDNWGEDLLACPRGGGIYWWDKTTGPLTRAQLLPDAPPTNEYMLVSDSGDQVICLGAFDPVANASDRMFIRTSDIGSLTVFTLADSVNNEPDNSVFEERLSTGSRIIQGTRTRNGIFIFTDKAQYLMQPDSANIYNIGKIAEASSIYGPNSALEVDGTLYGVGPNRFVKFDGVYGELVCPIWGKLFDNKDTAVSPYGLNNAQADKIYMWYNKQFSEIWVHYPSALSSENDRYAIINVAEKLFYYGSMARSAGSSGGTVYAGPFATAPNGTLYLHEMGTSDDGVAMGDYIESFDIQLPGELDAMHISNFVPDMKRITGTLQLVLKTKNRPQQASYVTFGPYNFDGTSALVGTRAAGRQAAIRIQSTGVNSDWRMGDSTFMVQGDAGER